MIGPNIDPWDILLIASLQLDSYQWPPPSGHGHSPGFQCTSLPAHIQQRRFLVFVCKTIAVLHCPFFFFFSCLAAFWSWLSNSPYWHLVRPWYHVQRGAGRGVAFHDLLRHRRKQQPCSTGSFITVSCPCIWTSCFQIALGLALTVVDWEVSARLSWNTHGADGNVLSEAFMHMQLVQRKTSQISLLLPAVLRVSCWMDS